MIRKKLMALILTAGMIMGMTSSVWAAPSINGVFDMPQVAISEGNIQVLDKTSEEMEELYKDKPEVLTVIQKINQLIQESIEAAVNNMGEDVTLDKIFRLPGTEGGDTSLPVVDLKLFLDNEEITDENQKGEILKLEDLKVMTPVKEMVIEGVQPTRENPVNVTFTANNITDAIDVYVLHYCDECGWELLNTKNPSELAENEKTDANVEINVDETNAQETTQENQAVASFHSLSPICLVYTEKADQKADTTSPETK